MDKDFSSMIKESIADEERKINSKNDAKKEFSTESIKRKIRNNFFAGFGIGLIVAAAAFYIFQPATKEELIKKNNKEVEEMKNSEIVERAKKLGMEFPNE